ncbi:hypothetical protein ANCDUO_16076, partial [Ancylostoma duodenale]
MTFADQRFTAADSLRSGQVAEITTICVSNKPEEVESLTCTTNYPRNPGRKLREKVKEDEEPEVVKATPMAKVCGNPRRRHSRISELVRISEERAKIPRAAAIASAKACKAIIQASQSVMPTTRDSLLGLHTPSPRPQRAKSNLLSKFTNTVNKDSKNKEAEEVPMRVLRSSSTS